MKKILLFPVLLIGLTLIGCNDEFAKFEIPYSGTITLSADKPLLVLDSVLSTYLNTKIDSILLSNNIQSDKINKVSLKKLQLILNSPVYGDLTFLKSMKVYITYDGVDYEKIAEVEEVPSCAAETYELNVEAVCLKYFLLKKYFRLKFVYSTDKPITEDYTINFCMNFLYE